LSDHVDAVSQCDPSHPEEARRQSLCGSLRESPRSVTTQHDKLREDAQFRILRLLKDDPEMSQRALAREVGSVRAAFITCSRHFRDKGLLKLGNFSAAEDKRRYAYVLTRKGIAAKADLTKRFLVRKMAEYELLKTEIDEVRGELSDAEMAELKTVLKDV